MNKNWNLVFVDCEADGKPSPATGRMTEVGAVHFQTGEAFHGFDDSRDTFEAFEAWLNQWKGRKVFISDNPAYDWQWVNYGFDKYGIENPFGHSARRIGDYYAGLCQDFSKSSEWKALRVTPHDHNPVNDARGNAEAVWANECGRTSMTIPTPDDPPIEIWRTRAQTHGMDYRYVGWSAYIEDSEIDLSEHHDVLIQRIKQRFPGRRITYHGN